MEYKKIDKKSYHLHLIKTDRFKTISIRVNIREKCHKEEINLRNFLMDILTFSTENYKTRKSLVEYTQDLYATSIYGRSYRIGKYNSINLFTTFLNEEYTEKGMVEKSIELLSEVLFHPNVENGEFSKEAFDIVKNNLQAVLKSVKDDPKHYSLIRMLENMADEEAYGYRGSGYQEYFDLVTPRTLYEYYKKVIKSGLVDIYVIGSYDDKEMEKWIEKYMLFDTLKKEKDDLLIVHEDYLKKPQVVKEKDHFNQSKLTIGCKLMDLSEKERNYVLSLYNIILGGSADSKFFKNIREAHSLCYYVNSSLRKLDNLLLIRSGISKENFEECVKLIKKEMKSIADGNITDMELEAGKSTYITSLDEVYDSPEALIEAYVATDLLGLDDIDVRKEVISKITKEEVVKLAKKVKMDTIYLLEGDMDNEEN